MLDVLPRPETKAAFERDERSAEAVCFALVVIGEAASRVPDDVQAAAPEIPWRTMTATRNIAAHECFGIDVTTVFRTAVADVPALWAAPRGATWPSSSELARLVASALPTPEPNE